MEDRAKEILAKHDCKFIRMLSGCRVLWENQNNVIRDDDIAVLSNISEAAWQFWKFA